MWVLMCHLIGTDVDVWTKKNIRDKKRWLLKWWSCRSSSSSVYQTDQWNADGWFDGESRKLMNEINIDLILTPCHLCDRHIFKIKACSFISRENVHVTEDKSFYFEIIIWLYFDDVTVSRCCDAAFSLIHQILLLWWCVSCHSEALKSF